MRRALDREELPRGEACTEIINNWRGQEGERLIAYDEARKCPICDQPRRLHVDVEGAIICYLCYEKAKFDLAQLVAGTEQAA